MRLFFWRRRRLSDFADAVRPELKAIATPDASPQLLERILASRAAGVRTILPEPVGRPRGARRALVVALAIAAAVVAAVGIPLTRWASPNAEDIVASSVFFAREAFAQPPDASTRSALPPLEYRRPTAIRPLRLEFANRTRNATGEVVNESIDTLGVAASDVDGIAAWRVVSVVHDASRRQQRVQTETLYVARADLRLLRRLIHVAPYSRFDRINVEQRFAGDSITGHMDTNGPSIGAGREIARQLRPDFGPYITDSFAPIALMAAQLTRTWQARASLLGWAVIPPDLFVPTEIRVVGEEQVQVPAGTFDCWRLSIRIGGRDINYWARKSDGLGVRVIDRLVSNAVRDISLARIEE